MHQMQSVERLQTKIGDHEIEGHREQVQCERFETADAGAPLPRSGSFESLPARV